MSDDPKVKAARIAEDEARAARDAIDSAAKAAGQEARQRAEKAYRLAHDYEGACKRLIAACRARIAAEDATPDHEWEGRRVFVMENAGPHWNRSQKRVEGVVETVRSNTVFASNSSGWRKPAIGEPIVRMLKKDGSPALKFESFYRTWGGKWALCDPASAAGARSGETAQPARSEGRQSGDAEGSETPTPSQKDT